MTSPQSAADERRDLAFITPTHPLARQAARALEPTNPLFCSLTVNAEGLPNDPSLFHAVSPNGQGDVTGSRRFWTCREVGRVVGTPVAQDGLLYVGDLGGVDTADRLYHIAAKP